MTTTFRLIDLPSQALAVQRLLTGLPDQEKLAWLASQGRLSRVPTSGPGARPVFRFESSIGLSCCVFIADDQFIFLGDHTTFTGRPEKPA